MEDGQSNSPEWRRQREEQLAGIIRELGVEASRRALEAVEHRESPRQESHERKRPMRTGLLQRFGVKVDASSEIIETINFRKRRVNIEPGLIVSAETIEKSLEGIPVLDN